MPHVFVGDDAFPLKRYMLKPYPFRSQSRRQRIFSYRLSRARRTVENAFGILSNRFRVFLTTINLHPSKVEKLLLASVVLHNMLTEEHSSEYSPSSYFDSENPLTGHIQLAEWRAGDQLIGLQRHGNRFPNDAKGVRETFCEYFNGVGKVAWQEWKVKIKM